jgi:ferredoxin
MLDRFDIDYALCMYCGICVEVCPFDALFWAPDFEYAEYDIDGLLHDKEKLEEWTYKVLPPPDLEEGAEPPAEIEDETVGEVALPSAAAPQGIAAAAGSGVVPLATVPQETAAGAAVLTDSAVAPTTTSAPAPSAPAPHVEPDQETNDRVLAEELAKGSDRRVAEGRAKRAAMIVARRKAGFA